MKYIEVPEAFPGSDGICSDDGCPCGYPGAKIPRGAGYMYVTEACVEFRSNALSVAEAERKIARLREQNPLSFMAPGVTAPILMCEQAVRRRGLDMKVAAADAQHWWRTGFVPLRATPLSPRAESAEEQVSSAASEAKDITFSCPRCGQHLVCEKSGAGARVPCPSCNSQIDIPGV